jgi:EmrB/QacA subfamily drug resistance transporter
VLANTGVGSLMSSIDAGIVIISLPTIARDLPNTSLLDLLWIVLGYQLVTAVLLVNFGRFSDMFGRIRFYKVGFVIFTLGSLLCSLSQSGLELVLFRLIQGVGATLLTANSAAIITDTFPVQERGRALGLSSMPSVAGSVFGLTLGGVLTQTLGWQSIFWVNLPIGAFAALWAHLNLRELGVFTGGKKVDYLGNLTFACGLTSILASITLYSLGNLEYLVFVAMMVGGLASMALFVVVESRVGDPMFDLSLFKIRIFTGANLGAIFNHTARGAVTLVVALYLQGPTMRLSPGIAGVYLIPLTITTAFWGTVSGVLVDRYDARMIATSGLLLSALGFYQLAILPPTFGFLSLLVPLAVIGTGLGLYVTPNRTSVMNAVPPHVRGVASGINTTIFNVGMILSQGIAFWIMSLYLPVSQIQSMLASHTQAGGIAASTFVTSVHMVYYFATALILIAAIPSALRGKNITYGQPEATVNPGDAPAKG